MSNQDIIFPQFCYLEESSLVNQEYFEMSCMKNGFQWPLKPISIWDTFGIIFVSLAVAVALCVSAQYQQNYEQKFLMVQPIFWNTSLCSCSYDFLVLIYPYYSLQTTTDRSNKELYLNLSTVLPKMKTADWWVHPTILDWKHRT